MMASKWLLGVLLTVSAARGHAAGLDDVAQGIAERTARKAATGAARDAVNAVFDDEPAHQHKGKRRAKGKQRSKPTKTNPATRPPKE